MPTPQLLTRLNRQDRREQRVPVIVRATPKQQPILYDWIAWVRVPPLPERLLVHVPIHQHRLVLTHGRRASTGRHINNKEWTAAWLLLRLNLHALHVLSLAELHQVVHLPEQVAVSLPLGVEKRRERGNADEFFQAFQILCVEVLLHIIDNRLGFTCRSV